MIERMHGVVQPYAWGSPTFIPDLLGVPATEEPQAELWLGAHPSAPSIVAGQPLGDLIAADPEGVLGAASTAAFGPRLPYLLKVLAAAQPLSLQAHPSRAQAEAGFAREEAAGIAPDAKHRLFKDDWPKPEMLCSLTDAATLCGFRPPRATYALFEQLGSTGALQLVAPLADDSEPEPVRVEHAFSAIMRLSAAETAPLLAEVIEHAGRVDAEGELASFAATACELASYYPGDPGVLAALLMNQVAMAPGDALYLPAGNLHAYLYGAGVEIMANSDNTLRGGLTAKHVDLPGLLQVLDFAPWTPTFVRPDAVAPGAWRYPTPAPEFALWRLEPASSSVPVPGTDLGRSLIVVEGSVRLSPSSVLGDELALRSGEAAFLGAGTDAALDGHGTAFLAGPGV